MFFDHEDKKEQKRAKQEAALHLQEELRQRFETAYFTADGLLTGIIYLVDKETGVEYLHVNGAITPLLTPDGKPKVKK